MKEFNTPFRLASEGPEYKVWSSHKLCEKCESIFFCDQIDTPLSLYEDEKAHHKTTFDIRSSKDSGCKLCGFIWARMNLCQQEEPTLGPARWSIRADQYMAALWIRLEDDTFHLPIRRANVNPDVPLLPVDPPESCNTGSESSLKMARGWLSACIKEHRACSRGGSADWLPTRLIHVGSDDSAMVPRLCLREEIPRGHPYLTLSHCWGQNMRTKLIGASFEQFRNKVPSSALPKTYLDAIHITRSLGYQYIWIDSICIIQDSQDDWRKECATMGLVYKNSTCNLAAAAGKDGTWGCFTERPPGFFEPLIIKTEILDYSPSLVHWWIITAAGDADEYVMSVDWDAPLYGRGWVLQEWFLAPRVLHFARDQIFWECSEGCASEGFPTVQKMDIIEGLTNFRQSPTEAGDSPNLRKWHTLISKYSKARFTKRTDKLPAFSGIAKEVANWCGFNSSSVVYLAGLWSHCIAQQLIWRVSPSQKGVSRLLDYPSWSWASVDGPIMSPPIIESHEKNTLIEVIHHETYPVGPDPYQNVTGGLLILKGWLWKMPFTRGNIVDAQKQKVELFTLEVELDDPQMSLEDDHFLLPVIPNSYQFFYQSSSFPLDGIILTRVKKLSGRYTRIGHFQIKGHTRPRPYSSENGKEVKDIQPLLLLAVRLWDEHLRRLGICTPDEGDYERCTKHPGYRTRSTPILGENLYTISIV